MRVDIRAGDLVIMPGEKLMTHDSPTVGVVVSLNDPHTHHSWGGKAKRVGVVWRDGDRVEFEPAEWLEVISESR